MRAEEVVAIGESRRVDYAEFAAATERRGGTGRRLLVGMKLNTSCREMLTWTIAKLAQPGDHILAIHVCSQPFHQGATDEEEESYTKQLANTLRGVLSVYESLCSLKQIKLQLEIVCGYKVKNVLVQVASSYEACKLILGTNKSYSVGRTKALGRYCLKRLPCTCTVVILEQGEIIFDKKGRLDTAMTRLDMIKVFGRSMRIGRNRKQGSSKVENLDDNNNNTTNNNNNNNNINNNKSKPSHGRQRIIAEVPDDHRDTMSFGSCSSVMMHEDFSTNSPVSVLPRTSASGFEALRICYSRRRAQGTLKAAAAAAKAAVATVAHRADMFLIDGDDKCEGEPLLEAARDSEDAVVPGWPLLNNTIGFENQTLTTTKKKQVVGERAELDPSPSPEEFCAREDTENTKSRMRDPSVSLAHRVDCLCSNRACSAFAFEDLEAATSRFSPENVVGRGGGSEVFRGVMRDGRVVAVKRLNPGPQAEEELLVDIEINTTLAHPHVVSLLGYCVEASHMLLVYDYLPHGNLEDHLRWLDMIKVIGRSMRIRRNRKLGSSKVENLDDDDDNNNNNNNNNINNISNINTNTNTNNRKPCHERRRNIAEVPDDHTMANIPTGDRMSFGSCSSVIHEDFSTNSPVSVLPRTSASGFEALRICYSRRRAQGTRKAAALAAAATATATVAHRADMFLIDDDDKCDGEPLLEAVRDSEDAVVPGWPLLNNTIGFENQTLTTTKKKQVVGERAELDPSPSPEEFCAREDTENTKSRMRDPSVSLADEVDCLCSNRACSAFAFEDLEAATSRFSPENVVGRGGGSEVFRGVMRDGRVVAVKRLNPGPQAEEELLVDIEINTTLAHPHVVSLLGYCVEASHMLLVYDYLPHGNLEDHLHALGKDAAGLPWEVRHKVAVGIARALVYLHKGCSRPVVHRDVKTSNILLTANFESQLSDFGLAKWAPTKASHLLCNDVVGTFGYLAPEYFMFGRVNDKTDVYAFGVVLLELITGRKPIDTTRPKGEENLVNWARPLLVEGALSRLVDPLLGEAYDVAQMNNMLLAAFLSIQQSATQRSQINQILQVLSGDHNKNLSACMSTSAVMSTLDVEDVDTNNYGTDRVDIRSHLVLAMVGVDEDSTSQCSVMDIPHSNNDLEEYLQGRFSRSTSFEDSPNLVPHLSNSMGKLTYARLLPSHTSSDIMASLD